MASLRFLPHTRLLLERGDTKGRALIGLRKAIQCSIMYIDRRFSMRLLGSDHVAGHPWYSGKESVCVAVCCVPCVLLSGWDVDCSCIHLQGVAVLCPADWTSRQWLSE